MQTSIQIYDPFYDEYYKTHKIFRPVEQQYISNVKLYHKQLCPACNFHFEKEANQIKKCPQCKTSVYTRVNFINNQKMILTREQVKELEIERGNIDFLMYQEEIKYRLKNREYGLYTNAKSDFLSLILERPDLKQITPYEHLIAVFEIIYLTVSGPNNVKNLPPNKMSAFNSKYGQIAPGQLSLLEDAILNSKYTLAEYEKVFIEEMKKFQLPEMHMLPETAWKRLRRHIKEMLEE